MIIGEIRKGKATITKQNKLIKSVTISQGEANSAHGSYHESPNGIYLVAFADGHGERNGNEVKWIDGFVCLIQNPENVLWIRRLGRPNDGAVSSNGRVAVNDWLRVKESLGGEFHVFDQNGLCLVKKEFNSNLGACAISCEGRYAVASTLFPDNSIYFFDVEKGELKWNYRNHSREPVLDLRFSEYEEIQVWIGRSEAKKKCSYFLDFEGKLGVKDLEALERVRAISKGQMEDSIDVLAEFLRSSENDQVLKGLKELKFKINRFRKSGRELIPFVSSHLLDEDEEIFQLSYDIILKFGEEDPDAIESAVKTILERIESHPARYREDRPGTDWALLGNLSRIRPQWVESKIPLMILDLENSVRWNARRFAACVLGEVGSINSEIAKKAVLILAEYLEKDGWWPQLVAANPENSKVIADALTAQMFEVNPEVWVRDAAIRALGDIGEKDPDATKDVIPAIVSCLKRSEPYTRRRAIIALGQISKRGGRYVRAFRSAVEEIEKEDQDGKVRLEARRTLEILDNA